MQKFFYENNCQICKAKMFNYISCLGNMIEFNPIDYLDKNLMVTLSFNSYIDYNSKFTFEINLNYDDILWSDNIHDLSRKYINFDNILSYSNFHFTKQCDVCKFYVESNPFSLAQKRIPTLYTEKVLIRQNEHSILLHYKYDDCKLSINDHNGNQILSKYINPLLGVNEIVEMSKLMTVFI